MVLVSGMLNNFLKEGTYIHTSMVGRRLINLPTGKTSVAYKERINMLPFYVIVQW